MKSLNVRELRAAIPTLKETLEAEHEILLVNGGEPVARILPLPRKRHVPSLAALRASMPLMQTPSEDLIRDERDTR
jgi:antitoxin (DNA-binding transcriptional repressor) of toxin-antitoxin stability system